MPQPGDKPTAATMTSIAAVTGIARLTEREAVMGSSKLERRRNQVEGGE
jgi:hypothetical protein